MTQEDVVKAFHAAGIPCDRFEERKMDVMDNAYRGFMEIYDGLIAAGSSPRAAASQTLLIVMVGVELSEGGMDMNGEFAPSAIMGAAGMKHLQLYKEPEAEG